MWKNLEFSAKLFTNTKEIAHENWYQLLGKKCPYLEFFWSLLSRIPTGKTPNTDTFYAVNVADTFHENKVNIAANKINIKKKWP